MSTIRITGGEHRGRRVPLPRDHHLRPTSDKARQAFFNIVGEGIIDATFLDLFAGTAIFSFEAISRGAQRAIAVEISRGAAESARSTAKLLDAPVEIQETDVFKALKRIPSDVLVDIVYADPPYDFPRYQELLDSIARMPNLASEAVVAIEHPSDLDPFRRDPVNLSRRKTARYGTIAITFFDHIAAAAGAAEGDTSDGIDTQ
jgi:16S rRNA (guanine966-N2)-methyltransferase